MFGIKVKWFSYKLHLAVDAKSELPMERMTPAHGNEEDEGSAIMTLVDAKSKAKSSMLDAGYDQMKDYEAARKSRHKPFIPLNPRNEKEPPAGITHKGTLYCSMGFPMMYLMQEKAHLKFRYPLASGQLNCPLGMAACSSSNYGVVVKINSQIDLRHCTVKVEAERNSTINESV